MTLVKSNSHLAPRLHRQILFHFRDNFLLFEEAYGDVDDDQEGKAINLFSLCVCDIECLIKS